ncbi:redoxin domain-containing protein [Phenylobacterium sp.]|uniref:redoxin domain-containing protein n=1 Tax=Phenylobacterium sp. TaxID=1871053 RepID=UPI001224392E|nr:redoxin domain-containing protein [Phenylobacterium sp.]THD64453.1 MAG: redoxin domain-containing protein [Phenylobacterium sp.]
MSLTSLGLWAGVLALAVASTVCVLPLALPRLMEIWARGGGAERLRIGLAFAALGVLGMAALALATGAEGQGRTAALGLGTAALAGPGAALSAQQRAVLAAGPWLNTPPLRAQDLRGKVVLVNFWTYSCINSLRVLPYVRAWAEKYRAEGLVVVGVHTPEFEFEKDLANVRRASASYGVDYPVVLDSHFHVWRAFNNEAWPALYFLGSDGRVRRQVLGEGSYDQSERLIQKLLSEANGRPVGGAITLVTGEGAEAAPDERDLGSPETYIGYGRASGFASPGGLKHDERRTYRGDISLGLNRWSLAGLWTAGDEFATLDQASGRIAYRFHARDLHLILGPSADGRPVRFRITIDGKAPGADHGVDVDAGGLGRVVEPRMYQLVRQARPVVARTFEIEFLDAGVRAYDFTFG